MQTTQKGSAIMTAIFVLIVVGFLGAVMVRLLQSGDESLAREVISTRALFMAESGAQKILNEIFSGGAAAACSAGSSLGGLAVAGMNGCSAAVTCNSFTVSTGETFYNVQSTGTCGVAPELAARTVEVQARSLLP